MSTIHDALKKAQKQREALNRGPNAAPVAGAPLNAATFRRLFAWAAVLAAAGAVLAYAVYLGLEPAARKGPLSAPRAETAAPLADAAPTAEKCYEKARALQKQGLSQEARKWYTQTLKLDPGHVRALNNLGVLLMKQGDAAAAKELLEKAVRLDPGAVDPAYNLACLHALAGDPATSIAYLKRAISLDPSARAWARQDGDLRSLRGLEPFDRLVGE